MMEKIKNSVRLTGYAGIDPVLVNFANDKRMARISLGVHEFYKNSLGEAVDQTQWFNLVFWNQKVELVENIVKKGTALRVEGKLSSQTYTDKNGEQRYSTEIVVNELEVVDRYEL
ncbi:single-stranded DNA-binding protein [Pedobacter sp. MR2016-24]|uniref:single-stranded DNA-binding protein n=1 Tax=Pedobacter sp. MR2016-24 TaxID=2994466 RepID=UPI002245B05D|nr:single-stranded DNA-binding protein [Pedobacter sp. MR2016-24]MCX2482532.1 single-stranded DNA-binding protein [Pedobacter sp. MR2016-24]